MKRQCNLCGLREDIRSLSKNKTWCLVYDKEVDNKFQNCEHWHPNGPSIIRQKVKIANDIKRNAQFKMHQQKIENEILLEPVQKELLMTVVEAARNMPIDNRQKFFVAQSFGGDDLIHPSVTKDKTHIYFGDVEALAREELLALGYGPGGTPSFDVTAKGFKYYEYLMEKLGEPVERIEKTIHNYIDTGSFVKKYPTAYEKWCSAEELLWKADSKQQLTLIGHLCREAIQEFTDCLVSAYNPSNAIKEKTKTVARLKSVIEIQAKGLGDTKRAFFDALVAYWGTVNDLIQRQEHDSQKDGQPLIWEDARTVVFQTLIVMFETDKSL